MDSHLDLNDVAAGHPVALEELAELRRARDRYESVSKMLCRLYRETGKSLDEILDDLIAVESTKGERE